MKLQIIATRIGHAILSMFVLTIIVFAVVRVTGDPVTLILNTEIATQEQIDRVRERLGLDQPVLVQYGRFLGDIVRGDLGVSYQLNVPVAEIVGQRLPYTLQLGAAALGLTLLFGVPLGVYAAYWRGGRVDKVARAIAVLGQAAPPFWIGLIMIWVLAVKLRWLPAGGQGSIAHLVLPAVTIAWAAVAGLTRLIRSSMIEVLEADYIKFLRIKGVPEWVILWKHGLRNAGLTALTFVGVLTAGLLTGSVVAETVFVWPGMGQLMAQSIASRDFPVVQAVMLIFAGFYILVNLVVDVLYAVLNPKLR